MKAAIVAAVTALGVWGGIWAFQAALHLADPYRPIDLTVLAGMIVAAVAIGWAVLATTRSPVRAITLGTATVLLPMFELAVLVPGLFYE